jgi:predicted DNA-binding transcriptional regulator AlpA
MNPLSSDGAMRRDSTARLSTAKHASSLQREAYMTESVDTREAAKILGLAAGTLHNWRLAGKGPQHFVAGTRTIRYRRSTLNEWINARTAHADGGVVA